MFRLFRCEILTPASQHMKGFLEIVSDPFHRVCSLLNSV